MPFTSPRAWVQAAYASPTSRAGDQTVGLFDLEDESSCFVLVMDTRPP